MQVGTEIKRIIRINTWPAAINETRRVQFIARDGFDQVCGTIGDAAGDRRCFILLITYLLICN